MIGTYTYKNGLPYAEIGAAISDDDFKRAWAIAGDIECRTCREMARDYVERRVFGPTVTF